MPGLVRLTETYVKWSLLVVLEVPAEVVTVTSTVPAEPAGAAAMICVSELTVKLAALPPKSTALAEVKPLPEMVTVEPPAAGPARD